MGTGWAWQIYKRGGGDTDDEDDEADEADEEDEEDAVNGGTGGEFCCSWPPYVECGATSDWSPRSLAANFEFQHGSLLPLF